MFSRFLYLCRADFSIKVIGPDDYNLTSELLLDKLLAMPFGATGQSRFIVPTNLKIAFKNVCIHTVTRKPSTPVLIFMQATHSLFRNQYGPPEIERPDRVAFRVNGEYFMRPVLSRSLSLP